VTLNDLTPRQREIAEQVGRGRGYDAIASSLPNLRSFQREKVSPRTVQLHVLTIARLLPDDGSTPYRRVMRWVLEQAKAA
jgi:DNA-binding CsgD family transcriptional regulator